VTAVAAVLLDATRTLFAAPDLGGEYARVLARHGVELAADELGRLAPLVWQELACSAPPLADRFGAAPGGSRGFWQRFVERVVELAGGPRPSRFAVAELYERFATAAPYRLYPEVEAALDELAAAGLRLAVVSNWDERLPRVLAALGLARRFAAVVISSEIGVEKPHPAIFGAALRRLGVAATAAVHVGDSRIEDVEGARAAGLAALHLARDGGGDLASLAELAAALALHSRR
jgi:putative hydrolase of the HAD superfamily